MRRIDGRNTCIHHRNVTYTAFIILVTRINVQEEILSKLNLRLLYYDALFTLERPDFTKWKPYAPAHDKK